MSTSWSTTFDVTEVNADLIRALFGHPKPSQLAVSLAFETTEPDLPPPPVRRPRLTGRRYRVARRGYGRTVRAWKRAGSPVRTQRGRLYMPRVDIEEHGSGSYTLRPTTLEETK